MDRLTLEQLYSSKTDDELLALSADEESLREEAKQILASELQRRNLGLGNIRNDGWERGNASPRQQRFLRSLRFGGILLLNVCAAVLGAAVFESEIGSTIHPHSSGGLLWKWWSLDLFCAAVIGFLMWRAWKKEASKWTWTLPALWFGLRFTLALLSGGHGSVLVSSSVWSQFSGADCENGWRPGSGCLNFVLFTAPFVRCVSFSIGAYFSSRLGQRQPQPATEEAEGQVAQ